MKQPMRSWQHFALLAVILAAGAMRTESDVHADGATAPPAATVDCAIDTSASCDAAPMLLAGR